MKLIAGQECRDTPIEINTGNSDIWAVTYAANGKYLLSGGSEKVQVWRVQDGKQVATMTAGIVRCVAMSKDSRWIAAGTFWGDVIVWNAETRVKVISRRDDNSIIHAVDFSPDSTRLVTASENHTASVWNISRRKPAISPLSHKGTVIAAKFSPQGDRIATATENSVQVYGSDDGRLLASIPVKVTSYYNSGLLWSNEQLVVVSDGKIKKIKLASTDPPSEWLVPNTSQLSRGIALPQHEGFIACRARRTVTFWDMSEEHPQPRVPVLYPQDIHSIALSPDDRFVAIGGDGGKIIIERLPRIDINVRIAYYWIMAHFAAKSR